MALTHNATVDQKPEPLMNHDDRPRKSSHKSRKRHVQSSRFIEGSLKDRVSKAPPPEFIDDYDQHEDGQEAQDDISVEFQKKMDQASEQVKRRVSAQQSTSSSSHGKSTSLFSKVGKTVSTLFTPWRSKEHAAPRQVYVPPLSYIKEPLDLRDQAAFVYAQMKTSGQFAASATVLTGSRSPQRDSGIDVQDIPTAASHDRHGKLALAGSPPRRQPSRSDLKGEAMRKVSGDSHRVTKPIKKTKSSAYLARPLGTVRNRISMHDLQRTSKLSKKISNLEAKLDAAKRELQIVAAEPSEAAILEELAPPSAISQASTHDSFDEPHRLPKLKASMKFRKRAVPNPSEPESNRKAPKASEADSPNFALKRKQVPSNSAQTPSAAALASAERMHIRRHQSSPSLPQIIIEAPTPAQLRARLSELDYTSPCASPLPATKSSRASSFARRVASIDGTLAEAAAASKPPSVADDASAIRNYSRQRSVSPLERAPVSEMEGEREAAPPPPQAPVVERRTTSLRAPELEGDHQVSETAAGVSRRKLHRRSHAILPEQAPPAVDDSVARERQDGVSREHEVEIDSPAIALQPGLGSVPHLPLPAVSREALGEEPAPFINEGPIVPPRLEQFNPRGRVLEEINVTNALNTSAPRMLRLQRLGGKRVVLPPPVSMMDGMMDGMFGENGEQEAEEEEPVKKVRSRGRARGAMRKGREAVVQEDFQFPEDVF